MEDEKKILLDQVQKRIELMQQIIKSSEGNEMIIEGSLDYKRKQ